jgi:hypothetical protein
MSYNLFGLSISLIVITRFSGHGSEVMSLMSRELRGWDTYLQLMRKNLGALEYGSITEKSKEGMTAVIVNQTSIVTALFLRDLMYGMAPRLLQARYNIT